MSKNQRLKELSEKYGLSREDFFKVHNNIIVTRTGVEKIASQEDIRINYEVILVDLHDRHACVKATATLYHKEGERTIETFGESSPKNTNAPYPVAMAEKRAFARAVLKLTEFYSHGVYSEDESEDFKRD